MAARGSKKSALLNASTASVPAGGNAKNLTVAQRIEQATRRTQKVVITDVMSWDCDALVRKFDTEGPPQHQGISLARNRGAYNKNKVTFKSHKSDLKVTYTCLLK